MDNDPGEVKSRANFGTASNDEDGVAKVIEKFILELDGEEEFHSIIKRKRLRYNGAVFFIVPHSSHWLCASSFISKSSAFSA